MKTLKERGNLDLLELVCQLHSRSLRYNTKELHDAYIEARQEMESRLNELSEILIILQSRLEQLIMITPTSESRNAMAEDNVSALIEIKKATQ